MQATRIMPVGLLADVVGGLMIFKPSDAELYKRVDEKGTIHFTEDPAAILFKPIYFGEYCKTFNFF